MTPVRFLVLGLLALGLAATAAFHAGGALDVRDALTAAAARGGDPVSPPTPLTVRGLGLGVDLVRVAWAPTGLFRAMHLAAGALLALAAALSATAAARSAGPRADAPVGPGLAAGLAVGLLVLFGRGLADAATAGTPVAALLVLLAGATVAWTSPAPRAFVGGLLCGAAIAEHPAALFLAPAMAALALGAPLRLPPDRTAGFGRRAALGAVVGLGVLLLPALGRGAPPLDRILADWWGGAGGPFWTIAPIATWPAHVADVLRTAWRAGGPFGAMLAWLGPLFFFGGRANRLRPFLVAHAVLAVAATIGTFRDPVVAEALLGWTFLFWMVPTLLAAHDRIDGAGGPPRLSPLLAVAAGVVALAVGLGTLDRSAERGTAWARASLEPLPPDAVLVTRNPVHTALATDGMRPDVRVVYPPAPGMDARDLVALVDATASERPVVLAPSVYFDPAERDRLLGERWQVRPWGPAFRVDAKGTRPDRLDVARAVDAWVPVDVQPGSPPSPLRGGLTGNAFWARALLQSASLYLELDMPSDAEREFLFALSLPEANRTLAAYGLAQILFREHQFAEAARTLRDFARDVDQGSWMARRLQANCLYQAGDRAGAAREMERAIRLLPPEREHDRAVMTRSLGQFRTTRPGSDR